MIGFIGDVYYEYFEVTNAEVLRTYKNELKLN